MPDRRNNSGAVDDARRALSAIDHTILQVLETEPLPETAVELAERVGISTQALSPHVKKLKGLGLVLGRAYARLSTKMQPQCFIRVKTGLTDNSFEALEELVSDRSEVVDWYIVTGDHDGLIVCGAKVGSLPYSSLIREIGSRGFASETLSVAEAGGQPLF